MAMRIIVVAIATGVLWLQPLDAAFARGGGGGGGGGGFQGGGNGMGRDTGGGSSTRGGYGFDRPETAADKQLMDEAHRECNGPKYPSGATPRVNYEAETFSCFEPGSTRR